ncbi:metal ABC transporter solute-binding protein, Zn/Mn family [Pontibacillus salicampi]|uniref:Metal ABC transporter solute-binding protein, Zn/Mn family n=1 Tax=Pontibacillus salicampi TaxID=1449801 RepID=A0ABV6LKM1_9BACI
MTRKIFVLFILSIMIGVLAACSGQDEDNSAEDSSNMESASEKETSENSKSKNEDGNLTVAVSVVPQATFVEKVAGDNVDIVTMIPPGNSPANYEPTPNLMNKFSDSDIYFSIGVPTEQANILSQKDLNDDIQVVNLADAASEQYEERQFPSGGRDPHVWMSPKRVQVMVDKIAEVLGEADPGNKELYEENAKEYSNKLEQVDKELEDTLAQLDDRTFIVYHPAFGYFAKDYDLEMVSLQKAGKEASPKQMEEIIDLAKEKNIKAIFYQKEISSEQAEAVAEEINGDTKEISPLNPDYINNLKNMAETFKKVLGS